MKIHVGSFLLGVVVGATGATLAKRLRPVGVELLSLGYRFADAAQTRLAMGREALEDAVAEAKARARGFLGEETPEPLVGATPEHNGKRTAA
ncbi:MAG TPA: hypothetical protein VFF73_15130 [Planctomycetota bacterium]|nr:hypothetical protein [Planctomycetota bacterium]